MCWLHEWDWRPLARLLIWCFLAAAAVRYHRVPLPDPAAILRELILGWLLTFGWLTWLQALLVTGAWRVFMALDDWTYNLAAWIVRPIAGAAPFAVNFLIAHCVQLGLVLGLIALYKIPFGIPL